MTAPKPVQLRLEALLRIAKAAHAFPADLNASALERQLSKAVYDYRQLSVRNINAQKTRLKAIHKNASGLAELLSEDEETGGLNWCSQWPKDWPSPIKVAEEIQRRVEESAVLETSSQKIIREIIPGSPLEWLIGTRLPEVFEQFFCARPTVSRKGRYLDFAWRVLTEFKITNHGRPYSHETIIRALTDARHRRSGRPCGGRK